MAFQAGKDTTVLVNDKDLSSYFNNTSESHSKAVSDITTFGKSFKVYKDTQRDGTLNLSGFYDGAVDASDEELQALLSSSATNIVSTYDGPAAVGQAGCSLQVIETNYSLSSPVADMVTITADFQSTGGIHRSRLLTTPTAFTVTANSTGYDAGSSPASTANGWTAYLHILANSRSANVDIAVQDSADNSTFAALTGGSAFATIATTTTASQKIVSTSTTATVRRYLRVAVTLAAGTGSISIAVLFARDTPNA